jgi:hypothetical protein
MSKGLLTLQTDLKSLRYGNDKPYVTKDINNAPSSNQTGMQATKRIDDLSRIAQMLVDRPGLAHLSNEALLKQVGVQDRFEKARKSGKSVAGALLKELGGTALTTVKVVGSTIAQVPVNGTGTHFLRGFRTDTYLQPTNGNQFSQFASFFGAGGVEGAPSAIKGQEIVGTVETALSPNDSNFSPYSKTGDQIHTDTTKGFNNVTDEEAPYNTRKETNFFNSEKQQALNIDPSGELVDFETRVDNSKAGNLHTPQPELGDTWSSTYTYKDQLSSRLTKRGNVAKETRINLGDQGARNDGAKRQNQYWTTDAAAIDSLNAQLPSDGKVNGETEGRDLIKFRFHILTADGNEKVLYFRAFLDSFADNFSGQWNPVKYLGRAEDFQVYGGFQRKITLSFKIAAATRAEMQPIYQKMVYLASATAPTYASGGQFMRGTLTKITVGDYIYELPGVLNSVNYNWNQDYPWEIAMLEPENTGEDNFEQELPMVMDCSIDFTPIHTFTPTTGLREYITTRLTEKGKKGIKNIENENTGIQSEPSKEVTDPVKPTPTYRPLSTVDKYRVQF